MVDRLHDGESPLRVWRDYRELTVTNLALQSGVRPAVIEGVENGSAEPVLSVAARLAEVLRIDVSMLVPWRQD